MNKKYHTKKFYEERSSSLKSAKIIVPLVLDLISPKSVVDVGCGTGEFLKVFLEKGVKDILGIDGFWIKKEKICIPKKNFKEKDLIYKININKNFDLAISLEVGEHLPKESAKDFVESLTNLSKIILFSSAIPLQGGAKHINEQWPEYWVKLFKSKNYVLIDCIREKIWSNKEIDPWYAQNTFLFVEKNFLKDKPKLKKEFEKTNQEILSIIHPRIYLPKARIYDLLKKSIPSFIQTIFSRIHPNI